MNENRNSLTEKNGFRFYPDSEHLAVALADELAKDIFEAVSNRGLCHMVFPGGSSPHRILELLRQKDLPWKALHLYPSDERCVPVGDPERNDRLIDELLLNHVPLPPENLHRIKAELGPEEGAILFSQLLKITPPFDIVLSGVGPDGHIASLFPGHPALSDERDAVPVLAAPKPPTSRVSIGLRRLMKGRIRQVVAIGGEKIKLFKNRNKYKTSPVVKLNATIWCSD